MDTAKVEVYDNYSFKVFFKNNNLKAQYEFQEAYDILSRVVNMEEFYEGDSWTDIYVAEDGAKYAILGNGTIEGCNEFFVFKIN